MLPPMTESRIALLSSVSCLACVVWLVFRPGPEGSLERYPPAAASQTTEPPVADRLHELSTQFEALRSQIDSLSVSRTAAPAVAPAAAVQGVEPLELLRQEVQALKFAVQALAELQAESSAGGVSHEVLELRREFPSTNWDACEILLQRALAAPGAYELDYLKSDNSPVLAELLMLRPRGVLQRFGSPTRTLLENGRFVWYYQAPQLDSEGQPARTVEITFDKGYVWNVVTDVSGS